MAALATAFVRIRPDTRTFAAEADKQIGSGMSTAGTKHGKRWGGAFASSAKSMLAGGGALLAAAGVGKFLGDSISAARESAKVSAQTAAVIKSTGGAAHVSSKQIDQLSTSLMKKTGIDDEAIKSGQNMLLTFTNIHNAAGKNNDIFNQSSKVLVDMTAALHGGDVSQENMRKQAIQLGKSLNDPAKGMTALARVGVTFTDQQKKQITTLTDSGDRLGAQKIILKELTKEFGGSAAAMATPTQKMKTAFGEVEESVGKALLPVFTQLANFMLKTGIPAIQHFVGVLSGIVGTFNKLPAPAKTAIAAVAGAILMVTVFNKIKTAVKALGLAMKAAALGNPWILLAAVIVTIAILIITHWNTIKAVTAKVWGAILGFVKGVWNWIKNNWPLLLVILTGPFGLAVVFIVRHWGTIKDTAKSFINWLRTTWEGMVQWLRDRFAWIVDKLLGFFGTILRGAATAFGWIPGLGGKLKTAANQFDQFRRDVNNSIRGVQGKTINVGVKFAAGHGFTKGGVQTGLAAGGQVRGPGGPKADLIPAMLSNKEWVMPAESVTHYGPSFMKAVQKRRLADGGPVGRFADGGPAGGEPRLNVRTPTRGAIDDLVNRTVYDMAKKWWAQFAAVVGWPFPRKSLSQLRRVDEGQDMQYPGTTPVNVFAILPGRRVTYGGDPGGFGSSYPGEVLDRPVFGFKQIYYGHVRPAGGGGHVNAGDVIGRTMGPTSGGDAAGLSNWLEIGFWPPSWANGPAMNRLLLHGSGGGAGSARGGNWTVGGMARLWDQAGGPTRLAHLMGAVGMAESGGRAWIINSIGATGLWQIYGKPFPGDATNPLTNARMAVSKYRSQGLGAWEAYTNGSYRQFLADGGPVGRPRGMAGGGLITEPIVGVGRSGQAYKFGERGSETVVPGQFSVRGIERRLEDLIRAIDRNAGATAAGVADALNGVSRSASYRAAYSVR